MIVNKTTIVKKLILPIISVAVLIAGAVMLGIGIHRYVSSNSADSSVNNVVSYYLTAHTSLVSFDDVKRNYTGAAQKLKNELSNALSSAAKQPHRRSKREAHVKPTVIILGMSAARQGGVIVMSGLLFLSNSAPDVAHLRESINSMSSTNLLNMIGDEHAGTTSAEEPLCSVVSDVDPYSTKTSSVSTTQKSTRPTVTTSRISTSSSSSSSGLSTSTTATTSLTTTSSSRPTQSHTTETTTVAMPIGPPGSLPCLVDIAIAFDASNEAGRPNFVKQINFVVNQLSIKWMVNQNATEVYAIAGAADDSSRTQGNMNYANLTEFHRDLLHLSCSPLEGDDCISCQFSEFDYGLWNRRKGVRLLTLVFAYTSSYEDVKSIIYYVDEFSKGNNKIVIVAVGDQVNVRLLKSITGSVIAANQFNEDLATKINAEICSAKTDRLPLPEAPSTTPQPITKPTTPATTLTTAIPPTGSPEHSNLTCSTLIAIIMDASNVAGVTNIQKQAEFIRSHLVSSWRVNKAETEMELYASAYDNYKRGKYMWNYPSNLQVYDDLEMLQTVGPFGDTCLDCAILLLSKDWFEAPYERPRTTIFFAYDTQDLDMQFAEKDVGRILLTTDYKLIIIGVGSKVNSTQLEALTKLVLLTDTLDEDLAKEINEMICSKPVTSPASLYKINKDDEVTSPTV